LNGERNARLEKFIVAWFTIGTRSLW